MDRVAALAFAWVAAALLAAGSAIAQDKAQAIASQVCAACHAADGTTMWLTQLTGPPMTGMDPTQQRLMRWMPWIFMFFLAQYTVGLVIYWSFSSVFTIVQQYVLMRRFKVENPIDSFFARFARKEAPQPGE